MDIEVRKLKPGTLFTLRWRGGPFNWNYIKGSALFRDKRPVLPTNPEEMWKLIHANYEWDTVSDSIVNGTLVELLWPQRELLYFPILDLYTSGISDSYVVENPITPYDKGKVK